MSDLAGRVEEQSRHLLAVESQAVQAAQDAAAVRTALVGLNGHGGLSFRVEQVAENAHKAVQVATAIQGNLQLLTEELREFRREVQRALSDS